MAKSKQKVRNIGIPNVTPPERVCEDPNCPFHGSLPVRGRIMEGVVTSTRMHKTITFQMDYLSLIKKYSRYERRRSKKHAHVPDCMDVREGDIVRVVECRPLSKTVSCVVVEVRRPETAQEE
ncbi:MAG: 30S ribosomal protein S17 [Candidatus Thorarchaeota archaeon]|nr:MAG: 30S ribosomal protein S17 [Candidatus Thorarchaeota archaeon]RLI61466.1 MAG: 30S ribosomal protein S17 [Candidatus Thorarchaeota archaeon]